MMNSLTPKNKLDSFVVLADCILPTQHKKIELIKGDVLKCEILKCEPVDKSMTKILGYNKYYIKFFDGDKTEIYSKFFDKVL